MTFTSAVLGEVQHPTNIIREYLEKFRGTQKCIALILSWLDGWIQTKLRQGNLLGSILFHRNLPSRLAIAAIQFTDTKEPVRGNTPTSLQRWPTDNIFVHD